MLDKDAAIVAARAAGIAVWEAHLTVAKFHGDDAFDPDAEPYEITDPIHNMLMIAGVNQLWMIATGQGGTTFGAGNGYVGVGDSATTAAATQTDLAATSNKLRKQLTTAPTVSGAVATFSATFGTSEANFAWKEVGVFNAASGGAMLDRFVADLGTKTTAASWTANAAVTIS